MRRMFGRFCNINIGRNGEKAYLADWGVMKEKAAEECRRSGTAEISTALSDGMTGMFIKRKKCLAAVVMLFVLYGGEKLEGIKEENDQRAEKVQAVETESLQEETERHTFPLNKILVSGYTISCAY